jgi:autophagy-related protein 9
MSNDGKMEKSFVSFKAAHPEWMPTDPTGSLYLSRIADLSARRAADDHTPRPPGIGSAAVGGGGGSGSGGPTTDLAREYERALHESQTAAVRRRGGGAVVAGLGFGATSTMLGQSTGTVYQSGMAQSVVLGDSDGSIALAVPQQQQQQQQGQQQGPGATKAEAAVMLIPSGSGELVADSVGEVRSALGESYVDGARRHPRGVGPTRPIQEEEDEEGLGADGGVLGLLAQIYTGTAGGGARGVLS